MSEIESITITKMDEKENEYNNAESNEMNETEDKKQIHFMEQKDKETSKVKSKTKLLKDVEEEERQLIYEKLYKSLLSDDDESEDDCNNNGGDDDNSNANNGDIEEGCSANEQEKLSAAENAENSKENEMQNEQKETENVVSNVTEETNTRLPNSEKGKYAGRSCERVEKESKLSRSKRTRETNTKTKNIYDMPVKKKAEMCGKSIQMMCMKQNARVFSFFMYTSIAMFTLPILTLFFVKNVIAPMCNMEKNISSGLSAIGVVIVIMTLYIMHAVKEEWEQEVVHNSEKSTQQQK